MRNKWIPRAAAVALVGASLAACGLPGGPSGSAILVISPNPGLFDFAPNSLSADTVVFTVKNVGFESTGDLHWEFSTQDLPLEFASAQGCDNVQLAPGDSCTITIELHGIEEPLGSYNAFLRAFGDDGGDATAPIFIV